MGLIPGLLLIVTVVFLEGQFALIAAAFAAHRDVFDIWWVVPMAYLAALLHDVFFYWVGKRFGTYLLNKRPKLKVKFDKLKDRFDKNRRFFLIGYRYMLGLRTIGPLFLGMINLPGRQFFSYAIPGVLVWTVIFSYIGYTFGGFFESHMEEIHHLEKELLIGIGIVVLVLLIRRLLIERGLMRKRKVKAEA